MKLYYVRGTDIRSVDVVKETKGYYYLAEYLAEFGFYERTPKSEACLTPPGGNNQSYYHTRIHTRQPARTDRS